MQLLKIGVPDGDSERRQERVGLFGGAEGGERGQGTTGRTKNRPPQTLQGSKAER